MNFNNELVNFRKAVIVEANNAMTIAIELKDRGNEYHGDKLKNIALELVYLTERLSEAYKQKDNQ